MAACGATASRCVCEVPSPPGDHAVHVCGCGGAWRGTWTPDGASDDFEVVAWPGWWPGFPSTRAVSQDGGPQRSQNDGGPDDHET